MTKGTFNIQMVDLKSQYNNIQKELDASVLETIRSGAFINGPKVKSFKNHLEEYLGVKHVIPCANGTDALQIALMAIGLKPGDEVIVPAFTYVATAEVIGLLQLTPIMVDVDPETFNVTGDIVAGAVTEKTRAIVPVHLFGQSADMEGIMKVAKKHNLYVIEDNAQAIGADYTFTDGKVQKTGTIGHIGCTSFYPSKNLGCYGDGGAMFTNDDELAFKLNSIANHGQSKVRYHHEVIGCNSRLDSIQAAILDIKLSKLDAYNKSRQEVASFYDEAFCDMSDLLIPKRQENSTHVFHQYTLRLKDTTKREELKDFLQKRGIPSMIYYPIPLYKQRAFCGYWKGGMLEVTEQLCDSVISLPIHTEMTEEMLKYITIAVKEFFQK